MKVGSLFSGIGGIEIGFEKAGFKTEWFIENEPYAQEILKKRFPEAKIYGDVTKVNFNQIP
ncbi:TPA: DNA (cytosine-5-)-methyltransferase, partial [Candidatus Woesearchaeota archaeon]|nr:DNA (cytosine-5-)-methyltransferase [Candidatus Woesearchaeota archaeon]